LCGLDVQAWVGNLAQFDGRGHDSSSDAPMRARSFLTACSRSSAICLRRTSGEQSRSTFSSAGAELLQRGAELLDVSIRED
jgi:hypothetical protein